MSELSELGDIAKALFNRRKKERDVEVDPMQGTTPMQMVYRGGRGLARGRFAAIGTGGAVAGSHAHVQHRLEG